MFRISLISRPRRTTQQKDSGEGEESYPTYLPTSTPEVAGKPRVISHHDDLVLLLMTMMMMIMMCDCSVQTGGGVVYSAVCTVPVQQCTVHYGLQTTDGPGPAVTDLQVVLCCSLDVWFGPVCPLLSSPEHITLTTG